MSVVIWVHDECLNPEARVFREYPGAPAVFVWDDGAIENEQWTLKRIGFVYECLLELPVSILRGDVAEQFAGFAAGCGASRIVTSGFVNPRLARVAAALDGLEVLEEPPLVDLPADIDLRRFSRYWAKAEPLLFGRKA